MSVIAIVLIYFVAVNDRSSVAFSNFIDRYAKLNEAVKNGDRDHVNSLIERGANVNLQDDGGHTPLHDAAYYGHEQIVNLLLRNGANVNVKAIGGPTPLHEAVWEDRRSIVNLLIDAGADINALDDYGNTPLSDAAVQNVIKTAEILIKRGASVNNQNVYGDTVLHEAVKKDKEGMVRLLMKSGANPGIQNQYGKTPIDIATENGHSRIVDLLRQRNADAFDSDSARDACATYSEIVSYRISTGTFVERGEFPWMAALGYVDIGLEPKIVYSCGGTIISDFFILTAAHCTKDERPPTFVRLGKVSLIDNWPVDESRAVYRRVDRIVKHPKYKFTEKKNDISLIRMNRRVLFTDDIRPACLQTDLRDEEPSVKLIVSGWGILDPISRNRTDRLQKTDLITMPLSQCNKTLFERNVQANEKALRNGLSESQYCAYDPDKKRDSCEGDSGGPLQLFSPEAKLPKVVGIVSWGFNCGSPWPGVYTRVAFYKSWIESIVWPNGFNTTIPNRPVLKTPS